MIKDNSGEKAVEKKDGQGGAKEKEATAKPADKEVTRQKAKENPDKGNSLQNVSEETMAQFSGTSKEVNFVKFLQDQQLIFVHVFCVCEKL